MSSRVAPYNHPYFHITENSSESKYNSQESNIFEQNATNGSPIDYFSPMAPSAETDLPESDIEGWFKTVEEAEVKRLRQEAHHAAMTHSGPSKSENQVSSTPTPELRKRRVDSYKSLRQHYEATKYSGVGKNKNEAEEDAAHVVPLSESTPKDIFIARPNNELQNEHASDDIKNDLRKIGHRVLLMDLSESQALDLSAWGINLNELNQQHTISVLKPQPAPITHRNGVPIALPGETYLEVQYRTHREALKNEERMANVAATRRDFWAAKGRAGPITKTDKVNKYIYTAKGAIKSWALSSVSEKTDMMEKKTVKVELAAEKPDDASDEQHTEAFRSIENYEELRQGRILDGHLEKIVKATSSNDKESMAEREQTSDHKEKTEVTTSQEDKEQKGAGRKGQFRKPWGYIFCMSVRTG
ncbi:hypothetical protein VTL71DRAFT_6875 [Oculimacula yallundae]|uniref:Uncharacterized protein n=1 Tax=Oculimacula yallundae TaxID=86028 RepID=A0ABR4BV25_9HELO